MRLIDAEYLKEHVFACATNGRPLHHMELSELFDAIDDVPTIEPERKTGKWITECERQMIDDVIGSPTWLDIASVRTMKRI